MSTTEDEINALEQLKELREQVPLGDSNSFGKIEDEINALKELQHARAYKLAEEEIQRRVDSGELIRLPNGTVIEESVKLRVEREVERLVAEDVASGKLVDLGDGLYRAASA